jgi:hypothetical protein
MATALRDRPEEPQRPKPPVYSSAGLEDLSTDELLDERNLLKAEGMDVSEIDEILTRRYS